MIDGRPECCLPGMYYSLVIIVLSFVPDNTPRDRSIRLVSFLVEGAVGIKFYLCTNNAQVIECVLNCLINTLANLAFLHEVRACCCKEKLPQHSLSTFFSPGFEVHARVTHMRPDIRPRGTETHVKWALLAQTRRGDI